ncbi:MAG TPA: hypothetical protein VNH19_16190, partial [Candidatus Limnocylindrales bacterium]|nr:hypothetical protein [Candidatus Limnocylindrales bacterium]
MRMGFGGWDVSVLNRAFKGEKRIPHPAKEAGIRDDRFGNAGELMGSPVLSSSGQAGCRRYLVAGFALVVAWLSCGSAVRAQKLQMPAHEKVVLKNGLTVLLLEKRSVPMVSVAGIVKAGGLADPAGQEGLASTTAGLLRKGTKT